MIVPGKAAHLAQFYVPWSLAIASGWHVDVSSHAVILNLFGFEFPLLRLGLATIGVLGARYLAPRRDDPPLSRGKAVTVTVLMLTLAWAWVIEDRPGLLFSCAVGLGLGFSGYSLIELAGREIEGFVKETFKRATAMIGGAGKDRTP